MLSRLAADSRAVCCWVIAQRDNLHVDAMTACFVVDGLVAPPVRARHATRAERSPLRSRQPALEEVTDFCPAAPASPLAPALTG